MELIVCVKQVPGTTQVEMDPVTGTLKRDGVSSKMNPYDLFALEARIHELEKTCLPCTVDGLHWLISTDENGTRYLTLFNNEGNERDDVLGDIVDRNADRTVTVTFRDECSPKKIQGADCGFKIEQVNSKTYRITVAAANFAVLTF